MVYGFRVEGFGGLWVEGFMGFCTVLKGPRSPTTG